MKSLVSLPGSFITLADELTFRAKNLKRLMEPANPCEEIYKGGAGLLFHAGIEHIQPALKRD